MEKPLVAKGESTKDSPNKLKESTSNESSVGDDTDNHTYEESPFYRRFFYDFILYLLTNIFDCFFREIRSRGGFKVPKQAPVIFVAAPHANQFVDPVILMGQVRKAVNRRVSFLVAEKSLRRKAVGFLARCVMSIGVVRAQDNLKLSRGKITVDPENPRRIIGHGTFFTSDCKPKGLLGLPKSMGNVEVDAIESDTVLTIRKEFKMNKPEVKSALTKGTPFKYADKVNQSLVYHKVFEHLAHNQCIGIFPEGGSHDRTDLLPLKAGVAIMALGCMDKHPDANVKIVPCGMNYFHPHKFRSRAVVEFGDPIEIPFELVAKYRNPETNREAVKEMLDTISEGLKAVTVTCTDYETLMVVQAMRRLYAGQLSSRLPLPMVVEMNRRLVKGYQTYRDDPKIIALKKDIMTYNAHLRHYNLPDHLVETARINFVKNFSLLVFRSIRLLVSVVLALPGIIMFSPVFIIAKKISRKKAVEALAASTVKIKANDVIATWKILIGMGFAPLLYVFWSVLITYNLRERYANKVLTFCISYISCCAVTYSALIIGDIGMDIFKSLRPLYYSITSPQGLKNLKKERTILEEKITEVVNTFGPELFPDFDAASLRDEYEADEEEEDRKTAELRRRRLVRHKKGKKAEEGSPKKDRELDEEPEIAIDHTESDAVSLVNSDNTLSNIPLFSTNGGRSETSLSSFMSGESSGSEFLVEEKMPSKNGLADRIAQAVWDKRGSNSGD